jgi:hypothetical protein
VVVAVVAVVAVSSWRLSDPPPASIVSASSPVSDDDSARPLRPDLAPSPSVLPPSPIVALSVRGLPPNAVVMFERSPVEDDVIEGERGTEGLLEVTAPGYRPYRRRVTLEADGVLDLLGLIEPVSAPVPPAAAPARQSGTKAGPTRRQHIDGRRPGSKIKILSGSR